MSHLSSTPFFFFVIIVNFIFCVCLYVCMHVTAVHTQFVGVGFLLPTCGSWGWNSQCQTWGSSFFTSFVLQGLSVLSIRLRPWKKPMLISIILAHFRRLLLLFRSRSPPGETGREAKAELRTGGVAYPQTGRARRYGNYNTHNASRSCDCTVARTVRLWASAPRNRSVGDGSETSPPSWAPGRWPRRTPRLCRTSPWW